MQKFQEIDIASGELDVKAADFWMVMVREGNYTATVFAPHHPHPDLLQAVNAGLIEATTRLVNHPEVAGVVVHVFTRATITATHPALAQRFAWKHEKDALSVPQPVSASFLQEFNQLVEDQNINLIPICVLEGERRPKAKRELN